MTKPFHTLLPLNLQFFAEGGESNESETTSNGQPSEQTETQTEQPPVKTFTQSELDDLIAKRIERERKKFSDYDDLKTKASEYEAKLQAQRDAEMTEIEKAQAQAKQFEEQLTSLTEQLEAERTKAQQQAITSEFKRVATSENIIDIDAAIALSDLSAVSIDDDGKVVGVEDVIKTLVEHKPYLVAKQKPTQPIGMPANNGTTKYKDKSSEQLLAEAAQKAKKTGRIEDRVAYDKLKRELSN